MSAVPLPALVLGGTSDLPSRVAFILSAAKADPAKATAAPSASVASVILVLDMVFSLLVSIWNNRISDLFPDSARTRLNLIRAIAGILLHTGNSGLPGDDGLVRAETIFPCPHCC